MEKVAVIIPAAGQGLRFGGDLPKQFVPVMGKPLLAWTLHAVISAAPVSSCIVVLPRDNFQHYKKILESSLTELLTSLTIQKGDERRVCFQNEQVSFITVPGGSERQESVWEGLKVIPDGIEWVAVHDGARPLVSKEVFLRVFEKARLVGAAIAAIPARDTVKRVKNYSYDYIINETLDRSTLWLAQTPQIFRRDIIIRAYEEAFSTNFVGTDDASLVERLKNPVAIVEGDPLNIKITSKEDMEWLTWHLQRKNAK
ncbi:MAG: 2-C-methyl-D-erythritol 4-phosphate cytidylyltransferase [Thermodesulforhabdaceae bacterium]